MLSNKQQEMVESSLWVVNFALKRLGLSKDEDIRQEALLYMCECATRYDEKKGVKWTTYAFKSVYLYIKRISKEKINLVYNDNIFYGLDNGNTGTYDMFIGGDLYTARESDMLKRYIEGQTMSEISEAYNVSVAKVCNDFKKIKNKLKGE